MVENMFAKAYICNSFQRKVVQNPKILRFSRTMYILHVLVSAISHKQFLYNFRSLSISIRHTLCARVFLLLQTVDWYESIIYRLFGCFTCVISQSYILKRHSVLNSYVIDFWNIIN